MIPAIPATTAEIAKIAHPTGPRTAFQNVSHATASIILPAAALSPNLVANPVTTFQAAIAAVSPAITIIRPLPTFPVFSIPHVSFSITRLIPFTIEMTTSLSTSELIKFCHAVVSFVIEASIPSM